MTYYYVETINPIQQCMHKIEQLYKTKMEKLSYFNRLDNIIKLRQWERPTVINVNTKVEIAEQYFDLHNFNPGNTYHLEINPMKHKTVLIELNHQIRMEISQAEESQIYDITPYLQDRENYLYLGLLNDETNAQLPECKLIEFKNHRLNDTSVIHERPLNYSI